MNVELRPPAAIKPYEKNPRDNDEAVNAVAESIRRFGFRQPIVVDADGVIVCGHTRWKAVQRLGFAVVPVHVASDLTPEQIRAYRIADNKTAELASGTWSCCRSSWPSCRAPASTGRCWASTRTSSPGCSTPA
jgi:ParB-like chromosome segregation protein Spo0J